MKAIYCAAHRVQRVDNDACNGKDDDEDAMLVKSMCKRLAQACFYEPYSKHPLTTPTAKTRLGLDNVLSGAFKFISRSTKRWCMLKRLARGLGYDTVQCRHTPGVPKLRKFQRLQKTRFVTWKCKAATAYIGNWQVWVNFLNEVVKGKDKKARSRAKKALKNALDARVVVGMKVYAKWAQTLGSLSRSTQGHTAVLPTLYHSLLVTSGAMAKRMNKAYATATQDLPYHISM